MSVREGFILRVVWTSLWAIMSGLSLHSSLNRSTGLDSNLFLPISGSVSSVPLRRKFKRAYVRCVSRTSCPAISATSMTGVPFIS